MNSAIGMATAWLSLASAWPAPAQTWSTPNLGGYIFMGVKDVSDTSYGAGFSGYKAIWPGQYAYYNSSFSGSMSISTWLDSQGTPGVYTDIEGGAGGAGFRGGGFGVGAVGPAFSGIGNGVANGTGNGGLYSVAQLSPCFFIPPTGGLRDGICGQYVGFGYFALPLLPGKSTTDGYTNIPTGNHWWTLFFNLGNFQGPVAVITPYYWSHFAEKTNYAQTAGQMLDSCWIKTTSQPFENETHTIPGEEYDGPEGSFLRVEPLFVPINHGTNGSIVYNSPTAYNQTLFNSVQQWLTNNGPAPVGPFTNGAAAEAMNGGSFGWGVWHSPLGQSGSGMPLDMSAFVGITMPDSESWGYQWGTDQVTYTQFANGAPAVVLPQYYQLLSDGSWTPVSPAAVPTNSGLASVSFANNPPVPPVPSSYTASDGDPSWTQYAAGPFQTRLNNGMVVTYAWYRFEDQPAIVHAGLTQAERDQLQAEVVKIHAAWTNGGSYIPSPTMGTLADADPAVLVTPPTNIPAVGYVPVPLSEAWGGLVTNTWNKSASGKWSVASNWASGSAPADGGQSYYSMNFTAAGSYTVTNDLNSGYGLLSGGYVANQLSFSAAVTLTGNPITLTCDYAPMPQLSQNSGNGVLINTPLNLAAPAVLGGSGSGLVIISNVISGPWEGLTINGPATWRLCGLSPNTYSGGTVINSGTVIWGAVTNGISPDCSYALGSGPVTLKSGATLQFEQASPTNALILNGGTLYAANSAGANWLGPVIVNSNITVRTDYGMGISGNISGTGGLTKTGTGTLTLSGVNTCTGATLVQTGTLACATSASLGAGALSISNGATANLNYSGTRGIFSLSLGGVNKLAGAYGSSSSPATYQDAHFSGTGTVTVPVPLSITNQPATGSATNQATLNASLGMTLAYAGTNVTALVYWGTVNGGTNPAAWAHSAYVGKWTNILSTNIAYTATGLAMNTTYYFAFLATNAAYAVWATNVLSFTTPQPPTKLAFASVPLYPVEGQPFSVTVQAQDANGRPSNVTSDTSVQLSESAGSGTLNGTVSGTIASGAANVTISGVTYSVADTMTLTATATAGMGLAAGTSPPIAFQAPTLAWDANGTSSGPSDGGGAWSNTNTWWNGTSNVNWTDYDNARIGSGGTGGTITLGAVNAAQVIFTNFGGTYTLTGGSLTVQSNMTVSSSAGNVAVGSAIGGAGRVIQSGTGTLTLSGTNSYSGGTVINGGQINPGNDATLGAAGTPITVNGSATLNFPGSAQSYTHPITINNGALLTLYGNSAWHVTGNVTGTGGIYAKQTGSGGAVISLDATANTFQGPILVAINGNNGGQAVGVAVASLADSPAANGLITVGGGATHGNTLGYGPAGPFFAYTGNTSLTLNNRQIVVATFGADGAVIDNNGTAGASLTINTDLLMSNTVAQTLYLWAGSGAGVNAINGQIADGAGAGTISLSVNGGTWVLSNTNTYSGATTISAGTLICSQASSLGSGALNIGNGTVANLNFNGTATISALTLAGTNMPAGVYGSTSSPAPHQDAHFGGTGTVTVSPPNISDQPATGITSTAAALNAALECAGAAYGVNAYWNTVSGGTNAALWTNSAYVGSWTNVISTNLSYTVTGLAPNTTYYFAFCATNALATLWATNVQSLTTSPAAPPVPVLALSGVTVSKGVPSFRFTAAAGCNYRLDYKNDLTDVAWSYGTWSTNTSGGSQSMTLTDPSATGQPHRYYRLEAAGP